MSGLFSAMDEKLIGFLQRGGYEAVFEMSPQTMERRRERERTQTGARDASA